ncbi:MAG: hypothetical protein KDJ67_03740, partial [Nitratireductor sp.]|nr:hypothetical protein [Nitratireductor sp.]
AIVRKILEDHGGTIELHDAPAVATGGTGAMVRMVLPLDDNAAAVVRGKTAEKNSGARQTDKTGSTL